LRLPTTNRAQIDRTPWNIQACFASKGVASGSGELLMGEGNKYFDGFIAGSLIGAVIGLLYAPKRGSQLRRDISAGSEDLYKQASNSFSEFRENASETLDDVKARSEELIERAEALRLKLQDVVATLKEEAAPIKERAMEIADDGKHRAQDLVQHGKELVDQTRQSAQGLAELGKESYKELTDQGTRLRNDARSSAKKIASDAKKVVDDTKDMFRKQEKYYRSFEPDRGSKTYSANPPSPPASKTSGGFSNPNSR